MKSEPTETTQREEPAIRAAVQSTGRLGLPQAEEGLVQTKDERVQHPAGEAEQEAMQTEAVQAEPLAGEAEQEAVQEAVQTEDERVEHAGEAAQEAVQAEPPAGEAEQEAAQTEDERVEHAVERRKASLSDETQAYTVNFLAAYARRTGLAGRRSRALARDFMEAIDRGASALRDVGDRALYIAGVVPRSLDRTPPRHFEKECGNQFETNTLCIHRPQTVISANERATGRRDG